MKKEVILVCGLGFGDEGKGTIVDYLTRTKKAQTIIRFNGGAQAGHNVTSPEGLDHTFSQFGSGTLVPEVKTYLSRFMVVNPLSMIREEEHLQSLGIKDAFSRTAINGNAPITTPFQIAANRLLETGRKEKRHGSCGMGIGRTIADCQKYRNRVLLAKDLPDLEITASKLEFLREKSYDAVRHIVPGLAQTETAQEQMDWLRDKEVSKDLARDFYDFAALIKIVGKNHLANLLREERTLIFEGAQGTLLDRKYGLHPYITKTNTTFANAYKLLREAGYCGKITRVGVLRGYATRHGAGPFPTEDKALAMVLKDSHNTYNQWQEEFRVGWLDVPLTKYAIEANGGIDYIALTNIDRLSELKVIKVRTSSGLMEFSDWQTCIAFLQSKDGLNVPIKILSFGPTWIEKTANL